MFGGVEKVVREIAKFLAIAEVYFYDGKYAKSKSCVFSLWS